MQLHPASVSSTPFLRSWTKLSFGTSLSIIQRAFKMNHRGQTLWTYFQIPLKKFCFFLAKLKMGMHQNWGKVAMHLQSENIQGLVNPQRNLKKPEWHWLIVHLLIYLDDLWIYHWLFVLIIIPKIQKCARVSYYASDQLYSSKETSKVGKWYCIHSGRVWAANVSVWHGSVGTNINLYM